MIKLTDNDRRWLEIVFYFLCRKIFNINQEQSDIFNFILGFRWTNLFDYDILIKAVKEEILTKSDIKPSKHEFVIVMDDKDCRLRMDTSSINELIRGTEYTYYKKDRFHAAMKEEINKTVITPKLKTKHVHETIYSFLLAIRYIADIIKKIKF